ncbi:MAG TPA: HK97 family phage prohead protease [Bryobacteraceae bacterium]|nr:HK97 family phage prohead protease [Bryobacteraceae bacterium]
MGRTPSSGCDQYPNKSDVGVGCGPGGPPHKLFQSSDSVAGQRLSIALRPRSGAATWPRPHIRFERRVDRRRRVSDGRSDGGTSVRAFKSRFDQGLSIGYAVPAGTNKVSYGEDGARTIREVRLHEISLVACPANPAARVVTVKSLGDVQRVLAALGSAAGPDLVTHLRGVPRGRLPGL